MKTPSTAIALFAILCCLVLASLVHAGTSLGGYSAAWHVVSGGGASMSGDSYSIDGTVGQTAIGWSTGDYQLGSGFSYGLPQAAPEAGHELHLPVVLKGAS